MLNIAKQNKQTSNASAKVVDGKLILSLPDAETPVVWQMDLTTTKASALEVRHNEEKGLYTLTLKTPKGETIEVAPFTDKAFAVEGLMAASDALENAHGQIREASQNSSASDVTHAAAPQTKSGTGKKWLIAIGAIIGLFIIINIWASISPRAPTSVTAAPTAATSDPRETSGVPMSADDFLRAQ